MEDGVDIKVKYLYCRYGESDELPVHVRTKLAKLPLIMNKLESAQTSNAKYPM